MITTLSGLLLVAASLVRTSEAFRPPTPPPKSCSTDLENSIKSSNLLVHANKLLEFASLSGNTRSYGTEGHNATVDYIVDLLTKTNFYDIEKQTFPYEQVTSLGTATTTTTDGENTHVASGFTNSPLGEVTGEVAAVANRGCAAEDFDAAALTGKIALVRRGGCNFGVKISFAGGAGATGAIIVNNAPSGTATGTLGEPISTGPFVPTVGITLADGDALFASLEAGTVSAHITTGEERDVKWTTNVLATTKIGDKSNVVVAGAHSDSVPAGPGLNDDGSGTIALLEIALRLPKVSKTARPKNAIRFGWWTAEEFGLIGSDYYVSQLSPQALQDIALYLNFDMIGSPNGGYFVLDVTPEANGGQDSPSGSLAVMGYLQSYFEELGIKTGLTVLPTPASDYGPFWFAGVPYGNIDTGVSDIKTEEQVGWWGGEAGVAFDKCYHQACDTVDNINFPILQNTTKAAAHFIYKYATSLQGIPRPRQLSPESELARSRKGKKANPLGKTHGRIGGCHHGDHIHEADALL